MHISTSKIQTKRRGGKLHKQQEAPRKEKIKVSFTGKQIPVCNLDDLLICLVGKKHSNQDLVLLITEFAYNNCQSFNR